MKKKSTRKKPVHTTRKKRPTKRSTSPLTTLKDKLSSLLVWSLVVVNVILISSLIHRLVTPFNPNPMAGADREVRRDAIDVEVLNGCGVQGLANEFSDFLRQHNHDVVNIGNADTFDYQYSILINRGNRQEREIKDLCDELGISHNQILPIESEEVQADVTFIIGSDYQSLKSYESFN